ncbi:MAG: DUF3823 domain-containing protein [Tannerella sp.]|jgi:hypothetical protein|nr:DUF3823 domain-containing protein [Tannerella sp.]
MKKTHSILFACGACIAACLISCETDNYSGPDGTITGRVIDALSGNPILTEQPDGFRIRYDEISWSENPVAQYFWGKADGTFNNTKLFAGTYEITPVEGAFVTPEPKTVEVKQGGTVTVDFTVTPYISFHNVSIVKDGATTVRVSFTPTKNVASTKPQDYRIFASSKTPYVGTIVFESDISTEAVALSDDDMGRPVSVTLDNYVPGRKYYIRAGARCENSAGRYNMTETVEIQM